MDGLFYFTECVPQDVYIFYKNTIFFTFGTIYREEACYPRDTGSTIFRHLFCLELYSWIDAVRASPHPTVLMISF